jgi:endonuclease-3
MDTEARRAHAARILRILEREMGTPTPEVSGDPLEELIATILSQHTTDANSGRAFASLRERFPSWRAVRDAPVEEVAAAIRMGGLAETKALRIRAILQALDAPDGEPSLDGIRSLSHEAAIAALCSFEGVGVKTAACVLLFALGRDVFPVDTHVHRVCNRLGLVATTTPDATFEAMRHSVPEGRAYALHVLLVRFGRRLCRARTPLCRDCPLFDECRYEMRHEIAAAQTEQAAASRRKGRER